MRVWKSAGLGLFAALLKVALIGSVTLIALGSLGIDVHWTGWSRPVHAQTIDLSQGARPAAKGHVQFAAEPQSVVAGKPGTVVLHFRVDPGFHINSHTPKSEMLIATKLAVMDGDGVDVKTVDFPAGVPYSFSFEPKTKLDVYTGDLVLTAHVMAQPGARAIKGALHYQACDAAACYPPKTLPVEQPFTAK